MTMGTSFFGVLKMNFRFCGYDVFTFACENRRQHNTVKRGDFVDFFLVPKFEEKKVPHCNDD